MSSVSIPIFTIITSIFDMAVITLYYEQMRGEKPRRHLAIIIISACIVLITVMTSSSSQYIISTANIALMSGILLFLYQGSVLQRLWTYCSIVGLALLSVFIVVPYLIFPSLPLESSPADYTNSFFTFFFTMFISHLIFLLLAIVAKRIQSSKKQEVAKKVWFIILLNPLISIAIMIAAYVIMTKPSEMSIFVCSCIIIFGILLMSVLNLFSFDQFAELTKEKNQKEALIQQVRMQTAHYRQLNANYQTQRSLQHDLKQFITLIQKFSLDKQYKEIDRLVEALSGDIKRVDGVSNTGNYLIDSIVNIKNTEAIQNEITINTDIAIPEQLDVPSESMIIILCNLLDNAIEACQKQQQGEVREINLRIVYSMPNLFVDVVNTCNKQLRDGFAIGATSKFEKDSHGIGLKNVQWAIKELRGEMMIKPKTDEFAVSVMIPLPVSS